MSALTERVSADLKAALKEHRELELSVYRMLKAERCTDRDYSVADFQIRSRTKLEHETGFYVRFYERKVNGRVPADNFSRYAVI